MKPIGWTILLLLKTCLVKFRSLKVNICIFKSRKSRDVNRASIAELQCPFKKLYTLLGVANFSSRESQISWACLDANFQHFGKFSLFTSCKCITSWCYSVEGVACEMLVCLVISKEMLEQAMALRRVQKSWDYLLHPLQHASLPLTGLKKSLVTLD